MDLRYDYITGAGAVALYVRQRNFAGKYGNFVTGLWDAAESVDTKVFFSEPDPVNAPGYFSCSFEPIPGGPWPLDIIEVSTGDKIGESDTDDSVSSVRTSITADHGAGPYGAGVGGEFTITARTVVAGTDPPVPVSDVTVVLFNEDASVRISQAVSDPMGYVTFNVAGGTAEVPIEYQIRHRKTGYYFDNDTTSIGIASVSHVCEGVALVVPAIDIPGTQTLIISAKQLGVPWAVGDQVKVTPQKQQAVGGSLLSIKPLYAEMGADGIAGTWSSDPVPVWVPGVAVDIGAKVAIDVGNYWHKNITVDDTPIKNVTEYP